MATNVFFSPKVRTEQLLYEDIIIESLKVYGQDVYYLPRDIVLKDDILNEDIESNFDSAYSIEMYIENTDGFEGEGDILSRFGVEIRDQATFIVSRRRWDQLVGVYNNGINSQRPNEGDLIYLPLSNTLFEIRFVEHESPFYQLSNLPVYKLQCEAFEYSGETIDTGNEVVDNLINQNIPIALSLVVQDSNGTAFQINETVQQEIGSTGEYVQARVANITYTSQAPEQYRIDLVDWITTDGEYHDFTTSGNLIGITSGAEWSVVDVYDINDTTNKNAFLNDNLSQNQQIEQAIDGIIDFTESNPFGDFGG